MFLSSLKTPLMSVRLDDGDGEDNDDIQPSTPRSSLSFAAHDDSTDQPNHPSRLTLAVIGVLFLIFGAPMVVLLKSSLSCQVEGITISPLLPALAMGIVMSLNLGPAMYKADRIHFDVVELWHRYKVLIVPATLDLLSTLFMTAGLTTITATEYVILRGTNMLFLPFIKAVLHFFRSSWAPEPLQRYEVWSSLVAFAAAAIVATTSIVASHLHASTANGETHSPTVVGLGIAAVLTGVILSVLQVLVESHFVQSKFEASEQTGVEGIVVLVEAVAVFFGAEYLPGVPDDWKLSRSFPLFKHSSSLVAMFLAFMCLMTVFAYLAVKSGEGGPVFRASLNAARGPAVFIIELALHRADKNQGQPWNRYGWGQVAALVLLTVALLVSRKGKQEQLKREEKEEEEEEIGQTAEDEPVRGLLVDSKHAV